MPATIKDIARRLNISYATVSRALNDRYGVNQATRQKVLEAARELKYHPNAAARGLVTRRTLTVGLILPEIENPFFAEVASGIERTAARFGYTVFLCITDWQPGRQEEYIQTLLEKRVEGLIIAPVEQSGGEIFALTAGEVPVVFVSDAQAGAGSSYVAIDNFRGGYLAASTWSNPAFSRSTTSGRRRTRSPTRSVWKATAGRCSTTASSQTRVGCAWAAITKRPGTGWCRKCWIGVRFRAGVFAVNDTFALGILQGVSERGLRVPEDVAIVGFDDIPMAAFPEIQLSTISQPKTEMGRLAVEILHEQIENPEHACPSQLLLPPRLVVRKTSEKNLPGTSS